MGFDIPDVIGMWVGQGDLPTPRFICDAAAQAMAAGDTFYTHKRGIPELRQAASTITATSTAWRSPIRASRSPAAA